MVKRIWICTLAIVLSCCFSMASASGLFPGMDEMFGTSMPSVSLVIGRPADVQEETENGCRETYLNFSNEDYLAFGQYLAGIGAEIANYSVENSTMTATISARNASMVLSFNWAEGIAIVNYPSGTRAETDKESVNSKDSILPPIGGVMPSAEFAIKRKPDKQTINEAGTIQTWNRFSDEDYAAFSAYLAETGAILKDSSIDTGILNAEISLNGFTFRFVFDWNAQTASVTYPEGAKPESSRWNVPVGSGFVLPEIGALGKELPRISMALEREPSSKETLRDGSLRETYLDFTEEDYNAFSQYLQKANCKLDDYQVEDNGVLIINLSNISGKMIFTYNAVQHIGIIEYSGRERIEKAWAPTPAPTPTPTPTPKPTSTPVPTLSPDEYNSYAAVFVAIVKGTLKNPNSLEVHEIRVMEYRGDSYIVIDFSAMNGFGGYNRNTYSFKFEYGHISLSGDSSDYDQYEKHKKDFSLIRYLNVSDVMRLVN